MRDWFRARRESSNPGNNLHVSGLPTDVDDEALKAVFVKVGRVQKVSIMCDPHTKDSRGFAFVTMETPEEAEAAINELNATKPFGSKVMSVEKVSYISSHVVIIYSKCHARQDVQELERLLREGIMDPRNAEKVCTYVHYNFILLLIVDTCR
ncbi:uncharacterized protein FOMMEDRAFT_82331 [Fomitiporia mediterranea MF3/22]|uniref:uncharacterized protein n=1 Tax=Fomitiporia mediterranea (strain MF3/22) TaxID=694068 RepID=UPI000440829E|nr:uncharacterized protein FOMMEDRAFT_82331 [Fomitiporia mediterranea MF3/22]EJD03511.1 hypothetical protein FOMMEDRAFT_82331 [Fomitiporia mediterranea MF3/22]